jgi:hypothetical protein
VAKPPRLLKPAAALPEPRPAETAPPVVVLTEPPVQPPPDPPVQTPPQPQLTAPTAGTSGGLGTVVVPRSVLYLQGLLLGVVGIGSFLLGLMMGRGAPHGDRALPASAQPSVIRGTVSFVNRDEETLPDAGAVVFALPQGNRPDAKLALDGLRPSEPPPAENQPGLLTLRSMGGNYARADEQGRFQLRVAEAGKYYLLFISARQTNRPETPPRHLLAELGRFFLLAPDLFGGAAYRWQEQTLKGDQEVNVVFH